MTKILQIATLLTLVAFSSVVAGDYIITINGKSQEISLNQESTLVLPDGAALKMTLQQKEYLRFSGDLFSFEHKSRYKPNRNNLGDGVFQTMIVTPIGTGILVQEYKTIDPSSLIDMMIKELTKEEVQYGYQYSEKVVTKKVGDATFSGKQAITTYPGEEWTRSVLSCGKKDKGLLVVTFIEKDNYQKEKKLIDHLWSSLRLKNDMK